jgi:RNA polymerase sigma-70 factor (ECF subfamily)
MAVVSDSRGIAAPILPDSVLLERAAGGDRGALNELFRRYRSVAYRVAYRLLGREADALDAVQDGFIKALTRLNRFQARCSFKTWLLRVVSNAALDIGRQRKREARWPRPADGGSLDDVSSTALPAPDHELCRTDLRQAIDAALAQLPTPQRQTFVLHVDGGLTYREIAETLNVSMGTVMSRLFYARQKLKVLLADQVLP